MKKVLADVYKAKKIEEYELQDLIDGKFLINKYDMNIKSLIEINNVWKIFAFDCIEEVAKKSQTSINIINPKRSSSLLETFKINYKNITNNLSTSIDDYPDLVDYVTFDEWLKCGNRYELTQDRKVILLLKY